MLSLSQWIAGGVALVGSFMLGWNWSSFWLCGRFWERGLICFAYLCLTAASVLLSYFLMVAK